MAQDVAQEEGRQSPWLSLSEAAERSGLHKEALRARAKRNQLPSRRNNLGHFLVMLPPDLLTPAHGEAQGSAQKQVEHLAELVRELEQELADARANAKAELAEAKAELTKAESERDKAREVADVRVEMVERRVADLQRDLDWHREQLAEARRPWWRRWRGS